MFGWLRNLIRNHQDAKVLTLVCMCQNDTWRWPDKLGQKTEGVCGKCNIPIFFEKQNAAFRKICNRCAYPGSEHMAKRYRDQVKD